MSESSVPKTPRDGVLIIEDGTTPTANTYTVQYSGDVSVTENQTESMIIFNRGSLIYVRKANDGISSITFTAVMTSFTDGTSLTVRDVLKKTGAASSWVKQASNVEHYNVKITLQIEGSDHGDDTDHTMVCAGCKLNSFDAVEGEPNLYTFNLEILGGITYTGPS